MPRKSTQKKEFNLLIPSLALSALVFLLAIAVAIGTKQPTTVEVSADNPQYLSKNDDVNALQNDLLLLNADHLDEEVSIINRIK